MYSQEGRAEEEEEGEEGEQQVGIMERKGTLSEYLSVHVCECLAHGLMNVACVGGQG